MKKCFVDQSGNKITIYSITPKKREMRIFRKKQLSTIPKSELFYEAMAHTENDQGILNSRFCINQTYKLNLYEASEIGYQQQSNILTENHHFFRVDNHLDDPVADSLCETQRKALETYLSGNNHERPFGVSFEDGSDEFEYFIPTSPYLDLNKASKYKAMGPIIHVPRMSYLLHLLVNDYMGLLKQATPEEFDKLLRLFTVVDINSFDLAALRNSEKLICSIKSACSDRTGSELSIIDELTGRAEAEKPFIEKVKKMSFVLTSKK